MDSAVLAVDRVCVSLGGREILRGVSLDVQPGEIFGIVGGSGSGKSVLLRTILGLTPRVSGNVRVLGTGIDCAEEQWRHTQRRMGVLFQQGGLFSSLSVKENIQVPMRELCSLPVGLMDAMTDTKLSMVGLSASDASKAPSKLSGGMVKRAALARALALDPEILFLDEPTSGLDPIASGAFDDLILTLRNSLGFAVFMITHDVESLRTVCDRAALLAHGRVVAVDTVAALASSRVEEVQTYFHRRSKFLPAPRSIH